MLSKLAIIKQIKAIGKRPPVLARAEFDMLPSILLEDEIIQDMVVGIYNGAYALMVATNKRLVIVDKMPVGSIVEEIPYDMIASVEYKKAPFYTQMIVFARSKNVKFSALKRSDMQHFCRFIEARMLEVRRLINGKGLSYTSTAQS